MSREMDVNYGSLVGVDWTDRQQTVNNGLNPLIFVNSTKPKLS